MPIATLNVKLLRHTPAPAETIALSGRICYSGDTIETLSEKTEATAESFVTKLRELGHLSPLEHASFTFGIEGVSRALLAQITRHRIASFSVQSQRYVASDDLSYIVPPSIMALGDEAVNRYKAQIEAIAQAYREWLDMGIPPEDARFLLPNASETRMILTMNARELLHFFTLRCCNRAQWEIRALAWSMLGILMRTAPALFSDAGAGCIYSGCTEGRMSCGEAASVKRFADKLRTLALNNADDNEITRFVVDALSNK